MNLPLTYSAVQIGSAQVDDDRSDLTVLNLLVTIPKSTRRTTKQPDVLLAWLREDEGLRSRCAPFVVFAGTQVKLVHIVLSRPLADIVCGIKTFPSSPQTQVEINLIRRSIGRITFENSDQTDCRSANIRELK